MEIRLMKPSLRRRPTSYVRTLRRTLAALEHLEERTTPSAYSVINTLDSGAGSLRQAILDANVHANQGGPDLIAFNIAGTSVHTISPSTALPTITDPVIIDGYSQPGSSPNTLANGENAVLQ